MKKIILIIIMFIPFLVNAETKYLYDVLKNEAESGGLAKEYTGEHHDSFTEEPTRKIYHWYANRDSEIVSKNNVYFGDYCWQMVRTTDTGGVKLIYNGIPEKVYRYKPLMKNQYTLMDESDDFEWDDENTTWNITYTSDRNIKGLTYKVKESGDYVINVSVKKSNNYYGYLYYYIGSTRVRSYQIDKNDTDLNIQFSLEQVPIENAIKILYYNPSSPEDPVNVKINVGEKRDAISAICLNKDNEQKILAKTSFNNNTNSIAYVGYMYNPSTLIEYKGWNSTTSGQIFGEDVSYSNGQYKLLNTSTTRDDNHHYTCFSSSSDTCSTVYYYYYNHYYTSLSNGLNIEQAVYNMLHADNVNQVNSNVKSYIEGWYGAMMSNYTSYLEDTIFCNDRSIANYVGWHHNGTLGDSRFEFKGNNITVPDLSCTNITDQFSMNNPKAKLKYPVALMTTSEYKLYNIQYTDYYTTEWLMTPTYVDGGYIVARGTRRNGTLYNEIINSQIGIRPVISLKPNIQYRFGNGSMYNPYIIKILKNSNININNNDDFGEVSIEDTNDIEEDSIVNFVIQTKKEYKIKNIIISDMDNNSISYNDKGNNEYEFIMSSSDVTITPVYEKVKSSINVEVVNETEDIKTNLNDLTKVEYEEKVSFKVTPIKGYKLNNIKIVDSDNNEIEYTSNGNEYSFIMPASDVTIIPSYEKVSNSINIEDNKNTKEIVIEVNDAKAVIYEDKVIFKVEPIDEYEIDNIEILDIKGNKVEYKKTNNNNEYEFIMPDTDVTIKPIYKLIYKFIEGMGQEYDITKDTKLRFRINMEYKDFIKAGRIYIDNELVDSKYYKLSEGSTIIIFNDEYSSKLKIGKHEIVTTLSDESSCKTDFIIKDNNIVNKIVNPNTGDKMILLIVALLLSLGIYKVILYKKVNERFM